MVPEQDTGCLLGGHSWTHDTSRVIGMMGCSFNVDVKTWNKQRIIKPSRYSDSTGWYLYFGMLASFHCKTSVSLFHIYITVMSKDETNFQIRQNR